MATRDQDQQTSARGTVSELPDAPPDVTGLTPRQQRILNVLRESIEKRGYPPSIREIGELVGLTSSSSVAHQLRELEAKGFIKRDPNRPRALEVFLPELMAARRALGTTDDSSYDATGVGDAAICSGDYVVVRQEQTADNGDIVAALIDGEATVKTFQRKDGHVWLLPHNQAYDPIDGTHATILGIVTAVLRSL